MCRRALGTATTVRLDLEHPAVLERVVVVLYEPQDPINIAATARAMKNMGILGLAARATRCRTSPNGWSSSRTTRPT